MKIVKEEKNEPINYPKLEEINANTIRTNSPKKWHKFGITTLIISLMLKSEAFANEMSNKVNITTITLAGDVSAPANTIIENQPIDIAGGETLLEPSLYSYLVFSEAIVIVFFLTILAKVTISTIISKIKKKEYKPRLVTKIALVLLLLSIVIIEVLKVLVEKAIIY